MNLDGFDFEGNLNLDEINKEANKNKFPEKIYQDLDECYKDNTTGLFYCSSKQNKDVVYVISERFYQIHTRGSNKVDSEQFLPLSEEEFNKFKKQEERKMDSINVNQLNAVNDLIRQKAKTQKSDEIDKITTGEGVEKAENTSHEVQLVFNAGTEVIALKQYATKYGRASLLIAGDAPKTVISRKSFYPQVQDKDAKVFVPKPGVDMELVEKWRKKDEKVRKNHKKSELFQQRYFLTIQQKAPSTLEGVVVKLPSVIANVSLEYVKQNKLDPKTKEALQSEPESYVYSVFTKTHFSSLVNTTFADSMIYEEDTSTWVDKNGQTMRGRNALRISESRKPIVDGNGKTTIKYSAKISHTVRDTIWSPTNYVALGITDKISVDLSKKVDAKTKDYILNNLVIPKLEAKIKDSEVKVKSRFEYKEGVQPGVEVDASGKVKMLWFNSIVPEVPDWYAANQGKNVQVLEFPALNEKGKPTKRTWMADRDLIKNVYADRFQKIENLEELLDEFYELKESSRKNRNGKDYSANVSHALFNDDNNVVLNGFSPISELQDALRRSRDRDIR